jgi:hypothetical protein
MFPDNAPESGLSRLAGSAGNEANGMQADGWLQNARGWWHPPGCLASWPFNEAREMWVADQKPNKADSTSGSK